jgi:hypothetical protein
LALFLAIAGGTVYAASKISGKTIKKGSEPGNRLKNDSVTGKQVSESTLGTVPSASSAASADTAQVAHEPLAFAQVNADGTVTANSRGITSANITKGIGGFYCFHGLAFTPKHVEATASNLTSDAFEVAEAALGDPGGLCASDAIPGAQAAVQISNPHSGTYPVEAFFVEFYD